MNSIGSVIKITHDKLIFEVDDFDKLKYIWNGQSYKVRGVLDYVIVRNGTDKKFVYQVVEVEDKEKPYIEDEESKFDYTGRFICLPIGLIENEKIEFNLKSYPFLQDRVYLANEDESNIIFSSKITDNNIELGSVNDKYTAYISPNDLFTYHTAIIGNTGSGKSSTIRIILSEINKYRTKNLHINVFDIHDEYQNLENTTRVNIKNQCKIKISDLELQDWINLVKPSELTQLPMMQTALRIENALSTEIIEEKELKCFLAYNLYNTIQSSPLEKRTRIVSLLNDIDEFTEILKNYDPKYGNGEEEFLYKLKSLSRRFNGLESINKYLREAECKVESFDKLLRGLTYAFSLEECAGNAKSRQYCETLETRVRAVTNEYSTFFTEEKPDNYEEKNGLLIDKDALQVDNKKETRKITIYSVSGIEDDMLIFFTSYILQKTFEKSRRTGLAVKGKDVNVFILEEAHRYINKTKENSYSKEMEIFKRIAREGRKFGCFLMLSSQRPSELSSTVLSQCNNYIIHRIKNNVDLEYLSKTIPYLNSTQFKRFAHLPNRMSYIVGELFPIPIEVEVKEDNINDVTNTPKIIYESENENEQSSRLEE